MLRMRFRCYIVLLRNVLIVIIILLLLFIYQGTKFRNEKFAAVIPKTSYKYVLPVQRNSFPSLDPAVIRQRIREHNDQERILNQESYGTVKRDTVILVVHVHKRTDYLKYLIMSLSLSKGIQDALVIFSHSYYDENINKLIDNIDFCRVLQIFYPYSIQANPHTFPSYQPNDCPHRINIANAEARNCIGAFTPDIHGRYRHPKLSEQKHHWWWTANKVFDNLTCTEEHEGIVLFLEDDIYFLEDFLYMALFMQKIAASFEQCEFLSLGSNSFSTSNENDTYRVEVTTWDPKYHSHVLAFDISVWNTIVTHYDVFCYIDDYSWARSLLYLSLNRRDGKPYKVMSSLVPRAIKIQSIGLYEKLFNSDFLSTVYDALDLQKRINQNLFPPHLEIYTNIELENDDNIIFDHVENNGGWSDPRDKELCGNMTVSKIKKVLLDMKNEFDYAD